VVGWICQENDSKYALRAKSDFLYSRGGICIQGSGIVADGRIISRTGPATWGPERIRFEWKDTRERYFQKYVAFRTAAVSPAGSLRNRNIYIPELVPDLHRKLFFPANLDG
jgi:hypothetical protein